MNQQFSSALAQGDNTPVVLVRKNETDLVNSRELRDTLVEREAVFGDERVKALGAFLLPKDFGVTTEQVANYFEVGEECINSLVKDNRTELLSNGLVVNEGKQLKSLKDTCQIQSRAKALTTFSRRAILNVAMLLRDSPVAKTIRLVLLDATESRAVVKEIVNQQAPQCMEDIMIAQLQEMKAVKQQLNQVNNNALIAVHTANEVKQKLDNQMTINTRQQGKLKECVDKRVAERLRSCYEFDMTFDMSGHRPKFYSNLWNDLKRRFGVARYGDILHKDFNDAIKFVQNWIEPADIRV